MEQLMSRRPVATAVLAAAGIAFTATPALAGGIVVVGSPSHDNSCAHQRTGTRPQGATTAGPGIANALLGQLPATAALNHCGGADLPCVPAKVPDGQAQLLAKLGSPVTGGTALLCDAQSTQAKGSEPLSDVLEEVAIL
ncbi:hypothetical protein [Streptomyces sp. cmx-4-9]|uniref:hypothetical protein n=1 Tax=Streptomyces sp. cmx-4-9 TaxID=2790941 RepID=UPI003980A931